MNVSILKIDPDPEQPRQLFIESEMSELLLSIKENGILQPLILEKDYATDKQDRYLLLDGERRYRCAKELNLTTLPAVIMQGPLTFEERTVKRFHIQEQHKNWSIFDKARSILKLKKQTKLTYQEVATKLNMFAPAVHNWISISDFSSYTQELLLKKKIQFNYLVFLIRLIKSYMLILKIPQLEIEKKLIFKIENKIIPTVADIQKFSNVMLKDGFMKEKIAFLNSDTQTLKEFFDKTNESKRLLHEKTLMQSIKFKNLLTEYTDKIKVNKENTQLLLDISQLINVLTKN